MTDIELISAPEQVTPEWLTTVLRAAGELDSGRVSGIERTAVGTGQVGDSIRFTITYEGGAGPDTVVGKFPAADETSRAAAAATRTYEVETRFYQQLRDRVAITTPRPYVALLDVEANDFVLLMNDLAPAEQGDQLAGCGPDEAALAMEEAAQLHAPVWGDATLSELAWLDRSSTDGQAFYIQLMSMFYPGFLERYGDRVDPEVVEVGNRLVPHLGAYLSHRPEPLTAAHGDYRLDNMLFTPDGTTLTTVDWQTVALAPGVTDVSYFLGTSLLPDAAGRPRARPRPPLPRRACVPAASPTTPSTAAGTTTAATPSPGSSWRSWPRCWSARPIGATRCSWRWPTGRGAWLSSWTRSRSSNPESGTFGP